LLLPEPVSSLLVQPANTPTVSALLSSKDKIFFLFVLVTFFPPPKLSAPIHYVQFALGDYLYFKRFHIDI
jgi:hypothetical protein